MSRKRTQMMTLIEELKKIKSDMISEFGLDDFDEILEFKEEIVEEKTRVQNELKADPWTPSQFSSKTNAVEFVEEGYMVWEVEDGFMVAVP